MKPVLFFAVSLMLASTAQAAPAKWKPLVSDDKKCVAMVPGDWGPSVTGDGLQQPRGQSQAKVVFDEETMADKKASLKAFSVITRTLEDSAKRYWIESVVRPNDPMHFRTWTVEVPAPGGVCSALISFNNTLSDADARTIATTLKKK